MASKLDPYTYELFEQLNNRGLSYRSVCNNLLGMGVEISAQSLRSWHVRRSRKIAARSSALPSLENCRVASSPVEKSEESSGKPPPARPAQRRAPAVEKGILQREIAEQEQVLVTTPFSHHAIGFLVKRKG